MVGGGASIYNAGLTTEVEQLPAEGVGRFLTSHR